MKYSIFLLLFFSTGAYAESPEIPNEFRGQWCHSSEENSKAIDIYKSSAYFYEAGTCELLSFKWISKSNITSNDHITANILCKDEGAVVKARWTLAVGRLNDKNKRILFSYVVLDKGEFNFDKILISCKSSS